MLSIKMGRYTRLTTVLLLLISLIYVLCLATDQVLFENFLGSLDITFDDFTPGYSKALKDAVSDNHPLQYDHYPPLATSNTTSKIPPTIHFIWFEKLYDSHLDVSKIPVEGSHAPRLCREKNPNFTVNVWNASAARDLLQQHYQWFLPTYDGYKYPIQRVDAFKYFLLWHYGGVYIDLDIACRRALDPLLDFPAWFPKAQPFGVNNDLMASRPRHPVIGKMTESLKPRDKNLISPYLTIFWTTGPQFTSDILKRWYHTRKDQEDGRELSKIDSGKLAKTGTNDEGQVLTGERITDPDGFRILPLPFYSEEYTFFGHSPGGTWHGEDVAFILWLVERPLVVVAFALTSAGLITILLRSGLIKRRIERHNFKLI